jgi:hypothetical protein
VLPFAGKEGFSADSWCPECAFYKLRRTPKKRSETITCTNARQGKREKGKNPWPFSFPFCLFPFPLLRELSRKVGPLAVRGEILIGLPVGLGVR